MWLLLNMGCGQSKHVASENSDSQNHHNNSNHNTKKAKGKGWTNGKSHKNRKSRNDVKASESVQKQALIEHYAQRLEECKDVHLGSEQEESNNKVRPLEKESRHLVTSGPKITDSQIEFFRMLDEKIEKGRVLEAAEYSS